MPSRREATTKLPGWDPAEWEPHLPALRAGDQSGVEIERLISAGLIQPLLDGRFVPLPLLLDGIVLTHRVSAAEIAGGYLDLDPDFAPLNEPLREGRPLAGGGELRLATTRDLERLGVTEMRSVIVVGGGLLDVFDPGDLVTLQLIDGRITVHAHLDVPPVSRSASRQLRRTARRLVRSLPDHVPDPAVTAREIVWSICAADPERWSQPEAPLAEQIEAADLVTAHGWVALPETDLDGYALVAPPPLPAEMAVGLFDEPIIDPRDLDLVGRAVQQERFGSLSPDPEFRSRLARVLAAPEAVAALTLMWSQDPGLERLCRELLPAVDGPALATAETLLARAAGRRGEVEEMRRRLVAALAADPGCEEAHRDAADLAEIRGDAAGALAHLEAAGADPFERIVVRLRGFAGRRDVPLRERAPWLWEKAAGFTQQIRFVDATRDVARAWLADRSDWAHAASGDLVVAEFGLFDAGLLATFLAERGALLPDDERELASSWVGEPWRLLRVEGLSRGVLHVRDHTTGERNRLDLVGESMIIVGQLVLGRILDNGSGSWLSYGAASVPEHAADDVARWLAEGVGGVELAGRLTAVLDDWSLVAERPQLS